MNKQAVRSERLPGGNLLSAVLDRQVMRWADRGGASNLVGDRWADLCATYAASWPGQERPVPDGRASGLAVTRVERLDGTPAIAAAASKRGLQNPDLLLVGTRQGEPTIQAADAKFSVETARPKQVSPAAVAGLLGLRSLFPDVFRDLGSAPNIVPGVFLCPDSALTDHMLRHRQGILRVVVRREEVVLVPAPAAQFFAPLAGAGIMRPLAAIDALPVSPDEDILIALYYFRLARAAVGCWLDATKPLLLMGDEIAVDEEVVRSEVAARATVAASAYEIIRDWDADVETVRRARTAVDQVAALPLHGRDLRPMIARIAAQEGEPPLPVNRVRRRLGAWYRHQLRQRVGPLSPPIPDLPRALVDLGSAGAALAAALEREAETVILALLAEERDQARADAPTAADPASPAAKEPPAIG